MRIVSEEFLAVGDRLDVVETPIPGVKMINGIMEQKVDQGTLKEKITFSVDGVLRSYFVGEDSDGTFRVRLLETSPAMPSHISPVGRAISTVTESSKEIFEEEIEETFGEKKELDSYDIFRMAMESRDAESLLKLEDCIVELDRQVRYALRIRCQDKVFYYDSSPKREVMVAGLLLFEFWSIKQISEWLDRLHEQVREEWQTEPEKRGDIVHMFASCMHGASMRQDFEPHFWIQFLKPFPSKFLERELTEIISWHKEFFFG